ncbi:MAG: hypothetical protein LBI44_01095 [Oscillospiraceae bacterium]|nr:hypothetical protein [Oscillospiraceae bacterium]
MKKKTISLLLAVGLLCAFLPSFASAEEPEPSEETETPPEPVTADVFVKSDTPGAEINLTSETLILPEDYTPEAYSLDGGSKWKVGAPPAGDEFAKLFRKELILWVTDTYNQKSKESAEGARLVKFPRINARPKANVDKLKPYYVPDIAGGGGDYWVLAENKSSVAVYEGYEYAETIDRKTPDDKGWIPVPSGGFPMSDKKTMYLARTAASSLSGMYTPASKPFKVKPLAYSKPTKYKISYKTETIRLKAGEIYSFNGGKTWKSVTERTVIEVSENIGKGRDILVRKAATGKSPRTADQTLTPLPRQTLTTGPLSCVNGKITNDMRLYEVYNDTTKKWGRMPKPPGSSVTYTVRLKAIPTHAASEAGELKLTVGLYDTVKNKGGIIAAALAGPPYPSELRPLFVPAPVVLASAAAKPADTAHFTVDTWAWTDESEAAVTAYPDAGKIYLAIELTAKDTDVYAFENVTAAAISNLFPSSDGADWTVEAGAETGAVTLTIDVTYTMDDRRTIIAPTDIKWIRTSHSGPGGLLLFVNLETTDVGVGSNVLSLTSVSGDSGSGVLRLSVATAHNATYRFDVDGNYNTSVTGYTITATAITKDSITFQVTYTS